MNNTELLKGTLTTMILKLLSDNDVLGLYVTNDYDSKYLASVSTRRDGSSRFGANNRYATFPAVSVAWRASEENFLKSFYLL